MSLCHHRDPSLCHKRILRIGFEWEKPSVPFWGPKKRVWKTYGGGSGGTESQGRARERPFTTISIMTNFDTEPPPQEKKEKKLKSNPQIPPQKKTKSLPMVKGHSSNIQRLARGLHCLAWKTSQNAASCWIKKPETSLTWVWVKVKPLRKPQVLVHVSIYQGFILGTYF